MTVTRTDVVYEGTLTTSETTVATIAANTTFIMHGFIVSNANVADKYFTLKIGTGTRIATTKAVPTKDAIYSPPMNVPVLTGKTIKITGEVAADMDYYIWGVNEVAS